MSDWAKTLLADVARQVDDEVPDGDSTVDVVQLVHSVLERRLLGLLEAGEAMWDRVDGDGELGRTKEWEAWDAAKEKASRP